MVYGAQDLVMVRGRYIRGDNGEMVTDPKKIEVLVYGMDGEVNCGEPAEHI